MYLIPYLFCLFLSVRRKDRFGYSTKKALILTLLFIPIGFIGAKLWYMIENPRAGFSFISGMSFYGTVLFVPLEQIVTAKVAKIRYDDLMDLTAPYGALCLCLCRIGCTLNGCCGAAPITINGHEVIPPIQLIECVLDFLLFLYLMYREKSGRILVRGEQTCVFTICYSFIRLVMEYYRDTEKELYGMSNGQWLAIITAIVAYVILNALRRKLRESRPEETPAVTSAEKDAEGNQ